MASSFVEAPRRAFNDLNRLNWLSSIVDLRSFVMLFRACLSCA